MNRSVMYGVLGLALFSASYTALPARAQINGVHNGGVINTCIPPFPWPDPSPSPDPDPWPFPWPNPDPDPQPWPWPNALPMLAQGALTQLDDAPVATLDEYAMPSEEQASSETGDIGADKVERSIGALYPGTSDPGVGLIRSEAKDNEYVVTATVARNGQTLEYELQFRSNTEKGLNGTLKISTADGFRAVGVFSGGKVELVEVDWPVAAALLLVDPDGLINDLMSQAGAEVLAAQGDVSQDDLVGSGCVRDCLKDALGDLLDAATDFLLCIFRCVLGPVLDDLLHWPF